MGQCLYQLAVPFAFGLRIPCSPGALCLPDSLRSLFRSRGWQANLCSTFTSFVPYRIPSAIILALPKNIDQRVKEHNEGKSLHTAKYGPWELAVYLGVPSKTKALDLEHYLKSGSGRAFLQRHIL
jgi:putative endonuclease